MGPEQQLKAFGYPSACNSAGVERWWHGDKDVWQAWVQIPALAVASCFTSRCLSLLLSESIKQWPLIRLR